MGSVFGGGSDTVETKVKLPKWVEQSSKELYEQGQAAAGRPYPEYPYARIAPFTQDEQASFDLARGNVGSWMPAYGQAFSSAIGATQPVGQGDIDAYMNPYTQSVIDANAAQMWRDFNRQTTQRHGDWSKAGTYLNEDRRAIVDSVAEQLQNLNVGQMDANLRNQAFQQAIAQGNAERNRQMSAVGQFGNLAGAAQTLGAGDVGGLQQIGAQQRELGQAELDLAYQDYLRQFGYSQEQINYLLGILQGTPYGQTTQEPIGSPNYFGQALGAFATVAGAGGSGGFGWW